MMPRYDGNYKPAWDRAEEQQYHKKHRLNLKSRISTVRNYLHTLGVVDQQGEIPLQRVMPLLKYPETSNKELTRFYIWFINGALAQGRKKARRGEPFFLSTKLQFGLRCVQEGNLWKLRSRFPASNSPRAGVGAKEAKARSVFAIAEKKALQKQVRQARDDHVKGVVKVFRRSRRKPKTGAPVGYVELPEPMWTDDEEVKK